MKTFDDLVPKQHPIVTEGAVSISPMFDNAKRCTMNFDNGYGVSVISGKCFYSDEEHPYEVAILKDGNITYDTPLTDDVLGYQTETSVTEIMKQVQELE